MPRNARHAAFTLIELLVVVLIVAIIIGLLLPAVQKARGAASRASCQHNMKNIALAAFGYENQYRRLPPGYLGPMPNLIDSTYGGQGLGVLALILPFMEEANVLMPMSQEFGDGYLNYHHFYNDVPGLPDWYQKPAGKAAAGSTIPTYLCPADIADMEVGYVFFFLHTYLHPITGDVELRATADTGATLGRTNYCGVAGYLGRVDPLHEGVFSNRSSLRTGEISAADGASNTLMFGEVTVGQALFYVSKGPETFAYGWMGCGTLPTGWGLPRHAQWYTFGSKHAGICNFAFADGSVRALRTGLVPADNLTFIYLSGWKDGKRADFHCLEN